MTPTELVLAGLALYLATGVIIGAAFVFRGVNRVDPAAQHASTAFRLLILPGAAALWPLVLRKWAATRRPSP